MTAAEDAEDVDGGSSSGDSVSSLSLDPPGPVIASASSALSSHKAPASAKKKPAGRALKATPNPRKSVDSTATSKMTTRGSGGRKKTVGFQRY